MAAERRQKPQQHQPRTVWTSGEDRDLSTNFLLVHTFPSGVMGCGLCVCQVVFFPLPHPANTIVQCLCLFVKLLVENLRTFGNSPSPPCRPGAVPNPGMVCPHAGVGSTGARIARHQQRQSYAPTGMHIRVEPRGSRQSRRPQSAVGPTMARYMEFSGDPSFQITQDLEHSRPNLVSNNPLT